MIRDLMSMELDSKQFEQIRRILRRLSGISLNTGKEALVKARLSKRLRVLGLTDFDSYLRLLENDASGQELAAMVDSLTTNKTSFFREPQHFDYLRDNAIPEMVAAGRKIRIWSAGCSSGEEPYSIAITLREAIPEIDRMDVRVLATDVSVRMLSAAREATYAPEAVRDLPPPLLDKYFARVPDERSVHYRVSPDLSRMVSFAKLNLVSSWPMKGPFDVIFCRNVMIYFDKPTQVDLIHRFREMLKPGGYLFVGHAESLTTSSHELSYVQPAIYMK